jgi:stage V sporulation protein SpoVS
MVAPVNASDLEVLFSPNRKPMFAGKPPAWWHKNGKLMAQQSAFLADTDCRELVGTVLELQRDDYWRKFSDDWGQFCQDTFGRPAEWVEQVVEGVRVLHLRGEKGEISADQARKASQPERAEADAQRMLALGSPQFAQAGDNQHTLVEGGLYNIKTTQQGAPGTSAAYLAARLKKAERDDLLAEIGPGKRFQSVRAAAIAAGIIKPVPSVRLVDDVSAVARKLRQHLTQQQITALVEALLL